MQAERNIEQLLLLFRSKPVEEKFHSLKGGVGILHHHDQSLEAGRLRVQEIVQSVNYFSVVCHLGPIDE